MYVFFIESFKNTFYLLFIMEAVYEFAYFFFKPFETGQCVLMNTGCMNPHCKYIKLISAPKFRL